MGSLTVYVAGAMVLGGMIAVLHGDVATAVLMWGIAAFVGFPRGAIAFVVDRLRRGLPFWGTGNIAFDEYREAELKRLRSLEEDFSQFLDSEIKNKSREEFRRFMDRRTDTREA